MMPWNPLPLKNLQLKKFQDRLLFQAQLILFLNNLLRKQKRKTSKVCGKAKSYKPYKKNLFQSPVMA